MKIIDVEKKLLKKFPAKNAFEWDKTGLLVGDPNVSVKKIAVALDPTIAAIRAAKKMGANLLLTHHPAIFGEIDKCMPANSNAEVSGAIVYEAINSGVALMNFHTALDVCSHGSNVLPKLLNLKCGKVLVPTDRKSQAVSKIGLGRICTLKSNEKVLTLKKLGTRCEKVFGRKPRVWGNPRKKLKTIVTNTGSVGSFDGDFSILEAAIKQKIDCIVCGEIKYHDALSICEAGVAIIELGHDVSEQPLCDVLIQSLKDIGVPKNAIIKVVPNNWY